MAGGTTSTLDAITKVFYVNNKVVDQLHSKSILFDKTVKKRETDVGGKSYTFAIRTDRNQYAGRGISESGDYGTVGNQTVANVVVPNKEVVTPIELSSRVLNATQGGSRKAFIDAFTMEVEKGMEDTVYALNRQLHSDGTDALAFWTGVDDSTATVVDDGQGNAFPIHLTSKATICDLIDAGDNATKRGNSIVVTKGAEGANDVALSWSGTVASSADGDYLVMEDTLGNQLMGIRGIVSNVDPPLLSGGLHGLTVAAQPEWVSQVNSNSGTKRDLTFAMLQEMLTRIAIRSNSTDDDIDLLMCNGYVFNKYVALCVASQYHYNTTTLRGGQTAVSFNGKTFVKDAQCRRNTLYFLNTSSLQFLTATGGLGFADWEGAKWKQKIGSSGYAAAYQAFITIEGDLCTTSRNRNGVILDITD